MESPDDYYAEIESILSSCDLAGNIRINAFAELATSLPLSVQREHEWCHREIQTSSGIGLFQFLLFNLIHKRSGADEETGLYRSILRETVSRSFLVHEGLATYVSFVYLLYSAPEHVDRYMESLPQSYRNAFRQCGRLLPRPVPMKDGDKMAYSYKAVAVLTGILLCSPPILEYYRTRAELLEDPARYITEESPDQALSRLNEHAYSFQAFTTRFRQDMMSDLEELTYVRTTSHEKADKLLQRKWLEWTARFQRGAAVFGFEHHVTDALKLCGQLNGLRHSWRIEDIVPEVRLVEGLSESMFSAASIALPDTVRVEVVQELHDLGDVMSYFERLLGSDGRYLLCIWDRNEETSSAKLSVESGKDGNPLLAYTSEDSCTVYVVDLSRQALSLNPDAISCTRMLVPTALLSRLAGNFDRPGWFCVAHGEPYILKQYFLYSQFPSPPYLVLPNVLLQFKNAWKLIGSVHTLLPEHKDKAFYGIFDSVPRMYIVRVLGEYMFAFSDGGYQENLFAEKIEEAGAKPWWTQDDEADSEKLSMLLQCMVLGHYILRTADEREEKQHGKHAGMGGSDAEDSLDGGRRYGC